MRPAASLMALLLTATTYWVEALKPYQPGPGKRCRTSKEEYSVKIKSDEWCCSRCPPGSMLKVRCNETADSVCDRCPDGQYTEAWNYRSHCFTCVSCGEDEGLQYLQNCTHRTKSRCVCQPGQYCILGYEDPVCAECQEYSLCPPGSGVSKEGTAESDVRCSPCPDGTVSDVASYTEPCKPPTSRDHDAVDWGGPPSTPGDSASATAAETPPPPPPPGTPPQSPAGETQPDVTLAPASTATRRTTAATLLGTSPPGRGDPGWPPTRPLGPALVLSGPGRVTLVHIIIPIVIGCVFLTIFLVMLRISQRAHRSAVPATESEKVDLFRDTNGNSTIVECVNHKNVLDTPMAPPAGESREQQCFVDAQDPRPGLGDAGDAPRAARTDPDGVRLQPLL